jgi:pimeloyl-ACP methyl ester carboxylesterase
MPTSVLNGVPLHYRHRLAPGPNVVFVHGLATNMAFWYLTVVPRLANDYAWTIYDLRGHGASGTPTSGYTTTEMAGDLAALLDQLAVRRAHLVGHSFGGAVALQYALLHPGRVASLTLADALIRAFQPTQHIPDLPAHGPWRRLLERIPGASAGRPDLGYRALEALADMRDVGGPDAQGDAFQPFGLWATSAQAGERWLNLLRTTTAYDDVCSMDGLTADRIERLSTPVLAIFGEYSQCLASCWGLRAHVRSVQVVIVPGVGHFHPLRRPTFFVDQLRKFISVVQATDE